EGGLATRSIDTIRSFATVNATTAIGCWGSPTIAPTLPFTIAGRANGASGEPRDRMRSATGWAPVTVTLGTERLTASTWKTTSGSSTSRIGAQSPEPDATRT